MKTTEKIVLAFNSEIETHFYANNLYNYFYISQADNFENITN